MRHSAPASGPVMAGLDADQAGDVGRFRRWPDILAGGDHDCRGFPLAVARQPSDSRQSGAVHDARRGPPMPADADANPGQTGLVPDTDRVRAEPAVVSGNTRPSPAVRGSAASTFATSGPSYPVCDPVFDRPAGRSRQPFRSPRSRRNSGCRLRNRCVNGGGIRTASHAASIAATRRCRRRPLPAWRVTRSGGSMRQRVPRCRFAFSGL